MGIEIKLCLIKNIFIKLDLTLKIPQMISEHLINLKIQLTIAINFVYHRESDEECLMMINHD